MIRKPLMREKVYWESENRKDRTGISFYGNDSEMLVTAYINNPQFTGKASAVMSNEDIWSLYHFLCLVLGKMPTDKKELEKPDFKRVFKQLEEIL